MNSRNRENFQMSQQQQQRTARQDRGRTPVNGPQLSPKTIQSYITKDDTAEKMVKDAEKLGSYLKENKVTTSQIRNAYGNMRKLEMYGWNNHRTRREVLLLKPRLAYAAGRHGNGLTELKKVMDHAIDAVTDEESFRRFCQFFEAIVAYHKAAGGK